MNPISTEPRRCQPVATFGRARLGASICRRGAFTLLELLVVIAIIGILSALTVGVLGSATRKRDVSRVQSELAQLVNAIEGYKAKYNTYPPDNANNSALNPLYYELLGTREVGGAFETLDQREVKNSGQLVQAFGFDGFLNVTLGASGPGGFQADLSDADSPVAKIFLDNIKPTRYAAYAVSATNVINLFRVPVRGTNELSGTERTFNPWRYRSTNPTNNLASFDLWADIQVGGSTVRICNWSQDPIPLD
jgi:prepilin-type N-terminal cleavage/methylation domain-containing protein